jgi:Zn-dependent M28 family amino/carboxypeptidase
MAARLSDCTQRLGGRRCSRVVACRGSPTGEKEIPMPFRARFVSTVLSVAFPLAGLVAPAAADDAGGLKAHASFFADDRLRGRDTGSAEYDIAALYAATRFASWGLSPGAAGSWYQTVRFLESQAESPRISARGAAGEVELTPVHDFMFLASVTNESAALSAPLVFVGYGIDAPELGLRDYEGLDVRGKVVLLVKGAPASFPNDQRAHYSSTRTKAENAEKHGAIGILVVRDRGEEQRVPWERVELYAGRPRTAWVESDGTIQDAFPTLLFSAMLSRPGATKLLQGSGLELDALLDSAERLDYRRRQLPIHIDASSKNRIDKLESPNVVALLPGSDPALRAEHVVVSAHLDHIGVGTAVDGDAIYNGFYDNALGSSILLETARQLAAAPGRPKRSILFLLVTGEERGLLGSDFFAHHPTVPAGSIVANVNVDMPLLAAPTADLVAFGGEHSSLGRAAAAAVAQHGFKLIPDPMPEEVIFVRSDQYSFVRQGVPSIYLTAGSGTIGGGDAQKSATQTFLVKHYHRPSDELELGADWDSAARFTAAQADLVRRIADDPARPRWNDGDFFGKLFGKK